MCSSHSESSNNSLQGGDCPIARINARCVSNAALISCRPIQPLYEQRIRKSQRIKGAAAQTVGPSAAPSLPRLPTRGRKGLLALRQGWANRQLGTPLSKVQSGELLVVFQMHGWVKVQATVAPTPVFALTTRKG